MKEMLSRPTSDWITHQLLSVFPSVGLSEKQFFSDYCKHDPKTYFYQRAVNFCIFLLFSLLIFVNRQLLQVCWRYRLIVLGVFMFALPCEFNEIYILTLALITLIEFDEVWSFVVAECQQEFLDCSASSAISVWCLPLTLIGSARNGPNYSEKVLCRFLSLGDIFYYWQGFFHFEAYDIFLFKKCIQVFFSLAF